MDSADRQMTQCFANSRGMEVREDGISFILMDKKSQEHSRFTNIGTFFDAFLDLKQKLNQNERNQTPN